MKENKATNYSVIFDSVSNNFTKTQDWTYELKKIDEIVKTGTITNEKVQPIEFYLMSGKDSSKSNFYMSSFLFTSYAYHTMTPEAISLMVEDTNPMGYTYFIMFLLLMAICILEVMVIKLFL